MGNSGQGTEPETILAPLMQTRWINSQVAAERKERPRSGHFAVFEWKEDKDT